jgi:hypothetical protein
MEFQLRFTLALAATNRTAGFSLRPSRPLRLIAFFSALWQDDQPQPAGWIFSCGG